MLRITTGTPRRADQDGAVAETSGADRPPEIERAWIESEHLLHTLVNSSSDLIAVVDERGQLLYANPAAGRMLGYTSPDDVSRDVFTLIHPDDREQAALAFIRDVTEPGIHPAAVYRFQTSAGGWKYLEVVATNCLNDPAIAGIVMNARDVTESQRLLKALRTLGQANQVLVHAKDETELLQETCRTIVDAGDYELAWVGFARHDDERGVDRVACAGRVEFLDDIHVTWSNDATGKGPIGVALRTGAVQAYGDLAIALKAETNRTAALKHGLRSTCVLPLRVEDAVIGALAIYSAVPDAFGAPEIQLLTELSDALAYGMGRLRDAASLQASEVRFRALAAAAPVGILEISAEGLVTYANSKIAELSATEVGTFMGRGWLDAVHPEDVPVLAKLVDRPRSRSSRSMVAVNFRIRRPDGEDRHVRALAAPEQQTNDTAYVVIVEDVTDELKAKQALTRQAYYDTLTGLANRALFLDRLGQELARRRRDHRDLAVLFVDLDRLKIVNDSLGHETGDALLREVGERFAGAIRTGDTAARFSGDEFIFLIRDVRDVRDAIGAAKRLLTVLEEPIHFDGHELVVTASVGIIIPGDDAIDAATVVRDADTAMYQAKASGGNRYAIFNKDLHRQSVARLEMEGDLRRAISRSEFEVYFQPIVRPDSGRPVGAEALLRWHHPARGLVPPLEFVPVAEELGLIRPIGTFVIETAVAQLAAWDRQPDGPRLDTMAINLSSRQLDDDNLVRVVRDALSTHSLAPSRLAFEVTESILVADSATTRQTLQELRDLGLQVAIDDFGTGYSSLSYLHALPVTAVKIDRSFIERLGRPDDSTSVVRAIIEMSHATGLEVVAEGVSDMDLQSRVSTMGCDAAQGFFWARPMPVEEFASWWNEDDEPLAST
jgi:diguanylate cyclase (GGDEF)-like protein/PAS domain S-box-containing protein